MTKKYNLCYDVLTIIACLMVVFFHCNSIINTCTDTLSWRISVVERCVVYSAIPIFFMLTGAKLMNYRSRYSTREYAKKRLLRVGIPFLFWNAFYVAFKLITSRQMPFNSVGEFITQLLNSDFQPRFWFFIPLFMVYLAIPVISLVLKAENHRKYLWYAVVVTFVLRWLLPPVLGLLGIRYNSQILMPVSAGYMMYVLFGYLVSTERWCRLKRIALYIAALGAGVFTVWYTVNSSLAAGGLQSYLLSYDYFPSALTGAAIFVFFKHLFSSSKRLAEPPQNSKAVRIVRKVSGACMGVWLTHSLGILLVQALTGLAKSSYLYRFACPPVVFLGCVAAVLILKKIPLLKHIV